MVVEKKLTMKGLAQEISILREQVSEIDFLKQKIVELEKAKAKEFVFLKQKMLNLEATLKSLVGNDNPSKITGNEKEKLKCKDCVEIFETQTELKKHQGKNHPRKIECKSCDSAFNRNSELEVHIRNKHKAIQEFQCEMCDKKFVLAWRLQKHRSNHTEQETKKCHCFNNDKPCPYEEVGCMFAHEPADMCKFGKLCKNDLCSYKHKESELHNLFDCAVCDFKSQNYSVFWAHIEFTHEEDDEGESNENEMCEDA